MSIPPFDPALALLDVLDGESRACLVGGLPERCLVGWWCETEALELVEASEAGCQASAVVEGQSRHSGQCLLLEECARGLLLALTRLHIFGDLHIRVSTGVRCCPQAILLGSHLERHSR